VLSTEHRLVSVVGALALLALGGCASLERLPAEPPAAASLAEPEIAGCLPTQSSDGAATAASDALPLEHCRFLLERETSDFAAAAATSVRREQAWWSSSGHSGPLPPFSLLALSGGGDDGAFGAGLLVGWTEAGSRPQFNLVTGISTGALIAPLAFLGPAYDPDLKRVYTTISQRDVFKPRGPISGFFSDALSDTTPLSRTLERYVDQHLLDAIAAEYQKGRLLLVGTSNLDTLEPVVWNMTAIAASKDPRALPLFRKILLASASIPGAFPPVMIDVEVNGVRYGEMHVDGGAEAQVFAYPASVRIDEAVTRIEPGRKSVLYVVRNSHFDPEWASVKRSTLPIVTRSISSLITNQGVGDLYQMYHLAERDGVDFNLAYIPASFDVPRQTEFDTVYMQALFKTGYDMARAGYPWDKYPPGYNAPVRVTPRQ
jgi:predicted acylesterase/phospholipase RssA